jgi:phosphomannomutase
VENKVKEEYEKTIIEDMIKKFGSNLLENSKNLNIVYSALNGCGGKLFCQILKNMGFLNLHTVKEQMKADENFAACKTLNPEKKEAFDLSINLAQEKNSDIIILTDPDGDRIGTAVKSKEKFKILNGNEMAALFLNFIIENNLNKFSSKSNFLIIKNMVSGGLINEIAKFYGIKIKETLPGFKNICKIIKNLENKNKLNCFLMAFEESQGYLFNNDVRDKDGIAAGAMMCLMVAYYKQKNINLTEILLDLQKKFGFFMEKTLSFEPKSTPIEKITESIYNFSEKTKKFEIIFLDNNKKFKISKNKNKIIARVSGTEPIVKFYIFAHGFNKNEVVKNYLKMENFIKLCFRQPAEV